MLLFLEDSHYSLRDIHHLQDRSTSEGEAKIVLRPNNPLCFFRNKNSYFTIEILLGFYDLKTIFSLPFH